MWIKSTKYRILRGTLVRRPPKKPVKAFETISRGKPDKQLHVPYISANWERNLTIYRKFCWEHQKIMIYFCAFSIAGTLLNVHIVGIKSKIDWAKRFVTLRNIDTRHEMLFMDLPYFAELSRSSSAYSSSSRFFYSRMSGQILTIRTNSIWLKSGKMA